MTKEMYEDLLERNRFQISELNTLTEEQDRHIIILEEEKCELLGIIQGKDKAIKELEERIEKMKCCSNCDFLFLNGSCYYDKECKNKDHWKLMR